MSEMPKVGGNDFVSQKSVCKLNLASMVVSSKIFKMIYSRRTLFVKLHFSGSVGGENTANLFHPFN